MDLQYFATSKQLEEFNIQKENEKAQEEKNTTSNSDNLLVNEATAADPKGKSPEKRSRAQVEASTSSSNETSTAQLNSSRTKNPPRKVTRFNSPHENTELENIVNTQRHLEVEMTGLKSFMNDKWDEITKLLGGYSNNTQPRNQ